MRIWLSFDLGVSGDYEGTYAWLDDKSARECGSSVANSMLMMQYCEARLSVIR